MPVHYVDMIQVYSRIIQRPQLIAKVQHVNAHDGSRNDIQIGFPLF